MARGRNRITKQTSVFSFLQPLSAKSTTSGKSLTIIKSCSPRASTRFVGLPSFGRLRVFLRSSSSYWVSSRSCHRDRERELQVRLCPPSPYLSIFRSASYLGKSIRRWQPVATRAGPQLRVQRPTTRRWSNWWESFREHQHRHDKNAAIALCKPARPKRGRRKWR